ncbi:MAG TPA: glutamate--cysteine ligase [Burkholderiales bacterium]|nr:glutamate--cysteine ligase [Burkholderiales bacterium]
MLRRLLRGIEKESLRTRPDGTLADTPHPAALGAALTHPHITTDFSESQLELITGVHDNIDRCLQELTEIHQFVYQRIGDEMLWCASMPCRLPADDDIPIGQYGNSNIGRAKTVYRQGLAHRYGRRMQTISGIHYNFSLPETAWPLLRQTDGYNGPARAYQDAAYFSLIRNFRRHCWLLLYLFGASPAVCQTFIGGRAHALRELTSNTLYLPASTSLRMGPLGYQSEAQATLAVSYNCLDSYARSLDGALTTPYPPYATLGIRDGEAYLQLSTALLQIENEFYGTIRPKRPIRTGERPLHALRERGVEYVEVRCIDLDPFCPIGITADLIRFLDVFLLHCLLSDSPDDTPDEIAAMSENQRRVAQNGRDPELHLYRQGDKVSLRTWGGDLIHECQAVAAALDAASRSSAYRDALTHAEAALNDAGLTPSARILTEMERHYGNSYFRFVQQQSLRHRDTLRALPLAAETTVHYARMAEQSVDAQRQIEAQDTLPFEDYRQRYLSPETLIA